MAYITKTAKGYRVQIQRKGVRDSGTFATKAAATSWAAMREGEILSGAASRWPRKTLHQAIERYAVEVSPSKRGARFEGLRLGALLRDFPALCGMLLSDITAAELGQWRDARLRVVTPASVQRDINLLRNLWSVACKEWGWGPTPTPWASVRMPAATPARDRLLRWQEIKRLMRRCDYRTGLPPVTTMQAVAWALLLSLRTAMRAGEVLSLSAATVDLKHRVARLASHKTSHQVGARLVPLTPRAAALLGQLLAVYPNGLPISGASLDALFRKTRDQVLLPDVHFHDARATALTLLARRVDVLDLARISGHRDANLLLRVYYRATAAEISARLALPRR